MNKPERKYANGIAYDFVTESDGWISIYEINPETFEREPLIQAKDEPHALSYINRRERISVPFNVL